jgi:predicted O-linked N-acetylglucosamine transferase (SPINDLY family)
VLERAGLDDLVTSDPTTYVEAASRLASDVDTLVRHRASLRDRVIGTGLTDGVTLAREMEAAYREWSSEEAKERSGAGEWP